MSSCKSGYWEDSNLSWQQWATIHLSKKVKQFLLEIWTLFAKYGIFWTTYHLKWKVSEVFLYFICSTFIITLQRNYWITLIVSINRHCVKSSRIRSFSGLCSVQIHQKKFEYGYFLRSKGNMYGIPKLFQNYLVGKVWQDQ